MANRYWVGNGGIWDESLTTHWSNISGGSGGYSAPTVNDDVFFDENSFSLTNQTVKSDSYPVCRNMDWGLVTNNPNYIGNGNGSGDGLTIYGNIILSPNMTMSDLIIYVVSAYNDITFDSAGLIMNNYILLAIINNYSISLLNNFINLNRFAVSGGYLDNGSVGIFNTNGWDITVQQFGIVGSQNKTFNLSTSEIVVNSSITFNGIVGNNVIINGDDAKLYLSPLSSGSSSVAFYDVDGKIGYIEVTDGTSVTLISSNSGKIADELVINKIPINVKFNSSYDEFYVGTFIANGTAENLIYIFESHNNSTIGLLSADIANVSYVDVKNNTAGGAGIPFDDSNGGIDSGGNTNWLFPPEIQSRPIYFPQV